jgi:predicted Zn-dependent protease
MDYSNPKIPEHINTRPEHPLKEFFLLSAGVLGAFFAVLLILTFFANRLAGFVPFEVEEGWVAGQWQDHDQSEHRDVVGYLQQLADRLIAEMDMPDGMTVRIHYNAANILNAYATLGGHIVIFQGLLSAVSSENTLAMILAHEIAHVRQRHPVKSAGRGVVIGLGVASLGLLAGINTDFLASSSALYLMKFSRDQEREADELALYALNEVYGHVSGAADLFEDALSKEGLNLPDYLGFISTHPLNAERVHAIHYDSEQNQRVNEGEITALPAFLTAKN